MTGAASAGLVVAVLGPGWALTLCAIGMTGTIPLLLSLKGGRDLQLAAKGAGMITELREGWTEFRSHTWLWATVIQYALVMMAFNGAFLVLGPVVARTSLGGPAAWGAITAADALGLVAGGLVSLRYTPRKPMLFVVGSGAAVALTPLALALVLPLPVICLCAFALGTLIEVMMVQWTVQMATRIPSDKLARVSSYDALGSMSAMPLGALLAGPLAAAIGVSTTQFAAAAVIVVASALTLIPREIWTIRADDIPGAGREPGAGLDLDVAGLDDAGIDDPELGHNGLGDSSATGLADPVR
jgi:predicted MFS family arabinose efflux permease